MENSFILLSLWYVINMTVHFNLFKKLIICFCLEFRVSKLAEQCFQEEDVINYMKLKVMFGCD